MFELQPLDLTAFVAALFGGIAGVLLAWAQLRKYARQAVEEAEREEPDNIRNLVEELSDRVRAQTSRIDEQARINVLQERSLEEHTKEIEELQKKLGRALEALAAFFRALKQVDPDHAKALQREYSDIMNVDR